MLYDRIPLSVKPQLGAMIRKAAKDDGLSVTAWIVRGLAGLVNYDPTNEDRPPGQSRS